MERTSPIGRVERYIDTDGNIKRALSYGDKDIKLVIWYRLDEIFQAFPLWKIPQPYKFYNERRFNMETRKPPGSKYAFKPSLQSQVPGDQSYDIQGKKGYRGRGRGRGTGQYQPRGRGRSTSRGGGRPSHKDSGWERDYKEWDEQQSSGSGTHRDQHRWEEDPWTEHEDAPRSHRDYYKDPDMTHQREGYHSTRYEGRKRVRSPSPRRYRRRDYSPRYEYESGRGRGGRSYSPEDNGSRRYPSHGR